MAYLLCNEKFAPLNLPHTFLPSIHPSSLWQPSVISIYYSVSVLLCLLICFDFKIPYTSEIMWYLSFSDLFHLASVQFSSVTQSCLTLGDPMNRSTPGLPVHHQLPKCTQTHVRRVSDAIQPSPPLLSPSPPAPQSLPASGSSPMSQLFASGGQRIGVSASASVLPMNI